MLICSVAAIGYLYRADLYDLYYNTRPLIVEIVSHDVHPDSIDHIDAVRIIHNGDTHFMQMRLGYPKGKGCFRHLTKYFSVLTTTTMKSANEGSRLV